MARYLLRRVSQAALVVWAAYTLAFAIVYALPGDPVSVMLSGSAGDGGFVSPEAKAQLAAELGLDRPLWEQYGSAVLALLRGDLGTSVSSGLPVSTVIADSIGSTLLLGAVALVIAAVLACTLVLAIALLPGAVLRSLLAAIPPLAASAPTFWIGLVLIQIVSFQLGLLPAIGDRGWQSILLPAITLAIPTAATLAQVMVKSLGTALSEPHIETAHATGARRSVIVIRHAGRSAAVAPVTVLGLLVANTVAGAVVVETVFARRGLGRVTATAVSHQDLPVVLGVVLVAAFAFVIVNLLTDLVVPFIDPRIRLEASARAKEVTS